jgi:hypothetical protein
MYRGEGEDPSLLLSLIARLPPESLTAALQSGGRHHFGWGQTQYLLADLFDALNLNTAATGNWKKDPPKFDPYPRPKKRDKQRPAGGTAPKKFGGLKAIHRQLMLRAANQGK